MTALYYKKLNEGAIVPSFATEGSAGADLCSIVDHTLNPSDIAIVPTGIALEIPKGHEVQIRPRSGLAAKYGVTVLNAPGTIDSDYRGEIKVILVNHGPAAFVIKKGDRIAQMVLAKVERPYFMKTETLEDTKRGANGFGSTGV